MDPLSLMFMASQIQQPQPDAFANPEMNTGGVTATDPSAMSGPGFGQFKDILGALKGGQGPKPQFSGGISGVQLPFRTGITDMITPALAQIRAAQAAPNSLPTLGSLFAQAPGGRR